MADQKRLIVTGAQGFVDGSILAQAGAEWEVHALTRSSAGSRGRIRFHTYQAADPAGLTRLFQELRPQAVIHTAALADIDYCQSHQDEALAVNVELTRGLAQACQGCGARLIFCSTDTVFDGEHAPYTEDQKPSPINFYAETKAAAEEILVGLGSLGVIARLSLVMGLPVLGVGNSFLARTLTALKEGRTVSFTEHEIRSPVDVITAGRVLLELAGSSHHGVFHLAGRTRLNRFQLGQQLAERFGFAKSQVISQGSIPVPDRAPRPRDVSLDTRQTAARLATPLLTLDEGITLVQQIAKTLSQ